ncbi:MAG: Rpn family recombination-promoting nuclease/putative transposase [Chitinispirillales bacterium]|jgi:predicted transposase/invertase (TIGR01784 family)|nr:Rpn family recombination-promoting nuclease/putative transposase [Chitinispirillales bacterium]
MNEPKSKSPPCSKEQECKHDESYKVLLSHKTVFLHFLKKYINLPWTANISPDDIELVNSEFITGAYKPVRSDLIYKLRMNDADVYFYVLLEQQSKVDHTMPFRLLRYMSGLQSHIFDNAEEDERALKGFRLPAIIPIVLYNGNDNWTAVRSYREYTKDYEVFGNSIIDFRYLLFDLKRMNEETFSSTGELLDIIFLLDKRYNRRRPDKIGVAEALERLAEQASKLADADISKLSEWMKYAGVVPLEVGENLKQTINERKGEGTMKHSLTTYMEEFASNCRAEGWSEGKAEGWSEGRKEAYLRTAKTMKAKGIDLSTIVEVTNLSVEDILKL